MKEKGILRASTSAWASLGWFTGLGSCEGRTAAELEKLGILGFFVLGCDGIPSC
jgi:hypothetical protein